MDIIQNKTSATKLYAKQLTKLGVCYIINLYIFVL